MTHLGPVRHLLEAWMPRQRWYPAKGRGVGVRDLGWMPLAGPAAPGHDGQVAVEVHLVGLDSGDRFDVVQVPLSYRSAPLTDHEHALVGQVDHPRLGPRWVYDAPHDPVYVTALLAELERPAGHAGRHRAHRVARAQRRAVEHQRDRRAGRLRAGDRQGVPHAAPRREPRRGGAGGAGRLAAGADACRLARWDVARTGRPPGPGPSRGGHRVRHRRPRRLARSHRVGRGRPGLLDPGAQSRCRDGDAARRPRGCVRHHARRRRRPDGLVDALHARVAWALRATDALDGHRAALAPGWIDST